jgi:hypothetical protein
MAGGGAMPVATIAAMLCLAAAAVIGAFAYAPDVRRGLTALARAIRALTHRPRQH